jgi:hypothetical protein
MAQSLEDIAYHEAGHFVASALIGQMPGDISIVPGDDNLGHVGRMDAYRRFVTTVMKSAKTDADTGAIVFEQELWSLAEHGQR